VNAKIYRRKDINDAYNAGLKTGIRQSLDSVLSVVTIVLQDHYGAKPFELKQLETEVNSYFQEAIDGKITLQEITEAKREEIDN
jgi:hypothetical protein